MLLKCEDYMSVTGIPRAPTHIYDGGFWKNIMLTTKHFLSENP